MQCLHEVPEATYCHMHTSQTPPPPSVCMRTCRRDWEAERARIASAEAEVARLLTEQQAQLADREERLLHIR